MKNLTPLNMTSEQKDQYVITVTMEYINEKKISSKITNFDFSWLVNNISNDYLPEDLNSTSALVLMLAIFKVYLLNNPTLHNESIFFITKPILSDVDSLLDTLIMLDPAELVFNTVLYVPLVLTHDLLLTEDIFDPTKSLNLFSHSTHFDFYINYSIIDNRLLYLKSEHLFFGQFIYNYSFNFSYINVLNQITVGSVSFDILYILRFIAFLLSTLLLTSFLNLTNDKQLDMYYMMFYKYLYSKAYQTGIDYRFALLSTSLLFIYWSFIVLNYDENTYSLAEVINSWLFYCFIFTATFTLFKLSFYTFALLELTKTSESIPALLVLQFGKDAFAWYGLVLRITSLLVRLTLYDTLDDLIESYYVFFDDFIDDSGVRILLVSPLEESLDFNLDGKERSLDINEKFFHVFDPYTTYINTLQSLFTFWFFLLEEMFRLILGTFIMYIILIEIYSGLLVYTEVRIRKK